MAERLTDFNKTGWVLKLDAPQNEFEARQQLMSKFKLACEKLGKIEDVMEEYGIESVKELKKKLVDSNIWQNAYELACEEINWCDNYDCETYGMSFEEILNYFYQKVKNKEKEDERN